MEGLSARVARTINIKERDFSIDSLSDMICSVFQKQSVYSFKAGSDFIVLCFYSVQQMLGAHKTLVNCDKGN